MSSDNKFMISGPKLTTENIKGSTLDDLFTLNSADFGNVVLVEREDPEELEDIFEVEIDDEDIRRETLLDTQYLEYCYNGDVNFEVCAVWKEFRVKYYEAIKASLLEVNNKMAFLRKRRLDVSGEEKEFIELQILQLYNEAKSLQFLKVRAEKLQNILLALLSVEKNEGLDDDSFVVYRAYFDRYFSDEGLALFIFRPLAFLEGDLSKDDALTLPERQQLLEANESIACLRLEKNMFEADLRNIKKLKEAAEKGEYLKKKYELEFAILESDRDMFERTVGDMAEISQERDRLRDELEIERKKSSGLEDTLNLFKNDVEEVSDGVVIADEVVRLKDDVKEKMHIIYDLQAHVQRLTGERDALLHINSEALKDRDILKRLDVNLKYLIVNILEGNGIIDGINRGQNLENEDEFVDTVESVGGSVENADEIDENVVFSDDDTNEFSDLMADPEFAGLIDKNPQSVVGDFKKINISDVSWNLPNSRIYKSRSKK